MKTKISLNTFRKAARNLLVTSSCIAFMSACSTSGTSNFTGVEAQNRNTVEMVRIPMTLNFAAGEESISNNEIAKLNHFLMTTNIRYGDEFSMDFPLERDGSLSALNQKRLAYISNLLKDSGLQMSAIVTPYGTEPNPNSARLLVSKYVVTPPQCGDWTQPSTPNYNNAPLSNLGCATQANLGLMIANPRDLITGQEGMPPNAERAAKAIERYQNSYVTVAPTSASGSSEGSSN